jgi:hypothetical protein
MGVKIVDTALRDGPQSLIATRITTEEVLAAAKDMDNAGYYAMEVWGGATFDACLRFLNEDPWERLREIRKVCKNTKLQMLFRGQNILGYHHYADDVVEKFVGLFDDPELDAVYGDVHFIHDGEPNKCIRYYSSKHFRPFWLRFGFMPAHPSFYCRRGVYERAGYYKTDYAIGSDYEMMVRLFKVHHINARYIPMDFVTMRTGGASTRNVHSRLALIKDDVRGCRENGVYTNIPMICMKFLYKIFEFRFS